MIYRKAPVVSLFVLICYLYSIELAVLAILSYSISSVITMKYVANSALLREITFNSTDVDITVYRGACWPIRTNIVHFSV